MKAYEGVLAIIACIVYVCPLDPVIHVVLSITACAILFHGLSDYCAQETQRGANRWSQKAPAPGDATISTSTSGN
jgi:uncharacterized membrane protein YhaH (DUF805 family)